MYKSELVRRLPSSRQRGELMRRTSVVEGGGEAKTSERLASSLFLTRLRQDEQR
jgi:hypothetical protein